jgi:hypothetical protein
VNKNFEWTSRERKKKVGKWEERSEREGPRGTNDDRTVPATSSYTCLRARAERRNGRTWRRERGGGGACSAAKPTSKIKLIRLSFSSSFCFSCDFFKKLFLVNWKERAYVRRSRTRRRRSQFPAKNICFFFFYLFFFFFFFFVNSSFGIRAVDAIGGASVQFPFGFLIFLPFGRWEQRNLATSSLLYTALVLSAKVFQLSQFAPGDVFG